MVRLLAEVDSSDECEHERPWRTYGLPPVCEFFSTLLSPLAVKFVDVTVCEFGCLHFVLLTMNQTHLHFEEAWTIFGVAWHLVKILMSAMCINTMSQACDITYFLTKEFDQKGALFKFTYKLSYSLCQ